MKNIDTFMETFRNSYKLKFEYRYSGREVNGEKDSVAAHSWNMMIFADYFLNYLEEVSPKKYNLDKVKVYEYIMYHDLVEAEVGDIDNSPDKDKIRLKKDEIEQKGAIQLSKKLPEYIGNKFYKTFTDFEERKDLESIFVKIMDVFEGVLHCYYDGKIWEDWNKDFYKKKYFRKEFDSFPELKEINEKIYEAFVSKGYLK